MNLLLSHFHVEKSDTISAIHLYASSNMPFNAHNRAVTLDYQPQLHHTRSVSVRNRVYMSIHTPHDGVLST
jgi:hypothetical protein